MHNERSQLAGSGRSKRSRYSREQLVAKVTECRDLLGRNSSHPVEQGDQPLRSIGRLSGVAQCERFSLICLDGLPKTLVGLGLKADHDRSARALPSDEQVVVALTAGIFIK